MKENRLKLFLSALLVFCAANFLRAQTTNAAHTASELAAQIDAHISQPRFSGALWGVKIVSLDSGEIIYENHADRLMSPASNSKLYPAALALDRLGPDYKIITPILATTKPDTNGVIHGDVVISGRGDPSWKEKYLGTNFTDLFSPFISELKKAGVRHVTGDLIADTTFFRGPVNGGSWTVEDLSDSEGAEISAITFKDNVTQVRVTPAGEPGAPATIELLDPSTDLFIAAQVTTGTNFAGRQIAMLRKPGEKVVHVSGVLAVDDGPVILDVPVPHAAKWFADALKNALAKNGVVVDGAGWAMEWPDVGARASVQIGEIDSPPLRELVKDFMKPSQNLETDLIFDHTGEMLRDKDSPAWMTSEQCAVAALEQFFRTNGLPAGDVHFDEGSGLSRNNLTTANASVALLQFMAKHPAARAWEDSLPIAGVDGTIRKRMKGTPAEKNVHAKTGTLRWVNALSGYVTNAAGEKLVFSLMLNRYDSPPGRKRTDELDDIAVMLARSDFHTEENLQKTFAPFGTLILTQFVSAPFPHPARAAGHFYHTNFYSAAEHYSNSDVAIFIPKNFRATDKIDFAVHFHGWMNTVASTLTNYQLLEQFSASGKNAVLLVPEGPHNAPDSFGGKLEDTNGFKIFMAEAVEKLLASGAVKNNFEIGNVIISGHSGGYHVMANILDHGGMPEKIKEAWLFDALYGNTENFVAWQKNQNGRLLDIYTDHGGTKDETENLVANYKTNGVSFVSLEETNSAAADFQKGKIVFIHTDLTHNETVFRRQEFSEFLKTSCLQNQQ